MRKCNKTAFGFPIYCKRLYTVGDLPEKLLKAVRKRGPMPTEKHDDYWDSKKTIARDYTPLGIKGFHPQFGTHKLEPDFVVYAPLGATPRQVWSWLFVDGRPTRTGWHVELNPRHAQLVWEGGKPYG